MSWENLSGTSAEKKDADKPAYPQADQHPFCLVAEQSYLVAHHKSQVSLWGGSYEPHHEKTCLRHMQSDQHLWCSLPKQYIYNISSFYIQNFKPLASFGGCTGRFKSYLVFAWWGSYNNLQTTFKIFTPPLRTAWGACHHKPTSGFPSPDYISHIKRKSVFGVGDQIRHKSACAAIETS